MNQDVQAETGGSGWGIAAVVIALVLVLLFGCGLLSLVFFFYSQEFPTTPVKVTFPATPAPPVVEKASVLSIEQRPEGLVLVLDGEALTAPAPAIDDQAWADLRPRLTELASQGSNLDISAPAEVPYANVLRALKEAESAGIENAAFSVAKPKR